MLLQWGFYWQVGAIREGKHLSEHNLVNWGRLDLQKRGFWERVQSVGLSLGTWAGPRRQPESAGNICFAAHATSYTFKWPFLVHLARVVMKGELQDP